MKAASGLFLLLIIALFMIGCPKACQSPDTAREVLENNGFTEIKITGYRWFSCDEKDLFHTGFEAVAPNGRKVTGVVCSGVMKANTIRFD